VSAVTRGEPASARLTVDTETPARRARSAIVGRASPPAARPRSVLRFAIVVVPSTALCLGAPAGVQLDLCVQSIVRWRKHDIGRTGAAGARDRG
jgi:hypothetical protein